VLNDADMALCSQHYGMKCSPSFVPANRASLHATCFSNVFNEVLIGTMEVLIGVIIMQRTF